MKQTFKLWWDLGTTALALVFLLLGSYYAINDQYDQATMYLVYTLLTQSLHSGDK